MFEGWSSRVASIDVASIAEDELRTMLAEASRLRSAVEAFEARCAARLGAAALVRGATRCTQREADRAVARGELIAAIPAAGDALADGRISGAHLDALTGAAERTTVEAVADSGLLALAEARPADAMRKQVSEFVRTNASDLAARLAEQRRNRRASLVSSDMGVLHVEFDDTTFGQVRAAIDAETDRLFWADGGRNGAAEQRTPQQRRADAVASLILGRRTVTAGPPPVRAQLVISVSEDGTGEIPGVGPLPASEVARLACISDLFGLVFSSEGQPLWLGQRVQLADDNQWRALIVRDGGCVGCGADPSRCEAHHVQWRRDLGPTDIDNLVLLCKHHHHLIHDKGWQLTWSQGGWVLAPP